MSEPSACKALNDAAQDEARAMLTRCCGSSRWVERMLEARPFASKEDLFAKAARCFSGLETEDWDEAFSHHPRIGDPSRIKAEAQSTAAWASNEQAGAARSSDDVRGAIAQGNQLYEAKFGRIYLVCATGKSGEELLAILRARLDNEPEEELRIAIGEQQKITLLRLEKLLSS